MASTLSGILDADATEPVDLIDEKPAASWRSNMESPRQVVRNLTSWLRPQAYRGPKSLNPTAYLDGLRGFAALLVYWHHHSLWVHSSAIYENAFGYEGKFYLVTFPGLRTFFTGGHYAVTTFFVLSGYVLSIKAHRLIDQNDMAGLSSHLASAIFRRWLRLFLPLVATVVLYATSWHLFGIWVHNAEQKDNWLDEMWALYVEFKNFSYIYKEGGVPWFTYNYHTWSIPVEMKGSMVVFSAVLAFSQCTRNARLWCLAALMYYFMYITDGAYCAMFVAGVFLSYVDLLVRTDDLPGFVGRLKPYKTAIFYHLFAISVYLGGVPSENRDVEQLARNRGWYFLSFLKPQAVFDPKWFYLFWAAIFLVASVPQIPWLRRFFETRFCQYLGRISYCFYLIHGPVLSTLGERLYMAVGYRGWGNQMEHIPWWADKMKLPHSGPYGLEIAFLVPHIILLPFTLFLADLLTRVVDKPSVRFAAWLYGRVVPEGPSKRSRV